MVYLKPTLLELPHQNKRFLTIEFKEKTENRFTVLKNIL